MNYESGLGCFPPSGESTNFATPPATATANGATQFVDGVAVFPRMLQYIEGGNIYNAINFSLEYNSLSGSNITAYSSVINSFICPSSTRQPSSGRDDAASDPNTAGTFESIGYGFQDYGPTTYTDIDHNGTTGNNGSSTGHPVPQQGRTGLTVCSRVGMTKISECTDGLSNTIAIAEDAGRDSRSISPYDESYYNGVITPRPTNDPTGYPGGPRRFWRWAEPDSSFGVSGSINNKYRPMNCPQGPWTAARLVHQHRSTAAWSRATTPATTTRSSRSTPVAPTACSATARSTSSRTAPTR